MKKKKMFTSKSKTTTKTIIWNNKDLIHLWNRHHCKTSSSVMIASHTRKMSTYTHRLRKRERKERKRRGEERPRKRIYIHGQMFLWFVRSIVFALNCIRACLCDVTIYACVVLANSRNWFKFTVKVAIRAHTQTLHCRTHEYIKAFCFITFYTFHLLFVRFLAPPLSPSLALTHLFTYTTRSIVFIYYYYYFQLLECVFVDGNEYSLHIQSNCVCPKHNRNHLKICAAKKSFGI